MTKVSTAPLAAAVESVRPAAELPVQLANLAHANSQVEARDTLPQPHHRREVAVPLTRDLRRFHIDVSRRFLEKLEAARAALSHARPGATAEEILEAGLDLVLAQQAKRKGIVDRPRKVSPPAKADHVPAHVKRAVWIRDGGRCQWPLESGGVCGSTLRIEFDHITPRALGGPSTIENIRVACAVHNQHSARQVFGDEWMDQFTRRRGRGRDAPPKETSAPSS